MLDDTTPMQTAIHMVRQKTYPSATRLTALLYVIEHFTPEFLPVLEELLTDPEETSDIRSGAALALGKLCSQNEQMDKEQVLVILERGTEQQTDMPLKSYCLQALGMLGLEEAIPTLVKALDDTDNQVFASAAESLGKIGKPAVPHLIDLLSLDKAEDIRCIAAWQLGTLGYAQAAPALVETVKHDENPEVLALALWALGEIGSAEPAVIEAVYKAKKHPEPSVSERAVIAMKKITRHFN